MMRYMIPKKKKKIVKVILDIYRIHILTNTCVYYHFVKSQNKLMKLPENMLLYMVLYLRN